MGLADIDIKKLPVLPQVFTTIANLEDDTDFSFDELDKLIRSDQSATSILLRAANSPLYARNQVIKSPKMAISILGFKMVRSLIVLSSTRSLFSEGRYEKFRLYVWRHSIVTAILSRALATRLGRRAQVEEAFVGGLLHDIGKVILNSHDRKTFLAALNKALTDNVDFASAEKEMFGFTHHDAGKWAIQQWKLPSSFERFTADHEYIPEGETGDEDEIAILNIIRYANYLAKKIGFGHFTPRDEAFGEQIEAIIGLSDEDREYFHEEFPKQLPEDEFYRFCVGLL